ncbi:MAG: Rieske 2Fe-2S domain-containing protein [Solirubrobacterales bacterium]|nr:Rieske 2Fe-2S domain-containing protein [Solirubrobacterales bacterium]
MCQCHGSRFDISTGAVRNGPATAPLRRYGVAARLRRRLCRGQLYDHVPESFS